MNLIDREITQYEGETFSSHDDSIKWLKESYQRVIDETKEKCIEEIKAYIERLGSIYDGKMPFVIMGQTIDDDEAKRFFELGVEQAIKVIRHEMRYQAIQQAKQNIEEVK